MTDLTALIDRLDNALYYAEPRQTVKLRREVAEAIRDALAALPAPHVPKQEPAALDRQTMVRALVEALAKGKMPDGSDMDEYIEPVNQADCAALGIPWPEHPHDRGVFIRECQREIMAGVLADAVLAALPAPHVPKQEPPATGDAWDRIVSDPRLFRARRRLSVYEIRLMILHAKAAAAALPDPNGNNVSKK